MGKGLNLLASQETRLRPGFDLERATLDSSFLSCSSHRDCGIGTRKAMNTATGQVKPQTARNSSGPHRKSMKQTREQHQDNKQSSSDRGAWSLENRVPVASC